MTQNLGPTVSASVDVTCDLFLVSSSDLADDFSESFKVLHGNGHALVSRFCDLLPLFFVFDVVINALMDFVDGKTCCAFLLGEEGLCLELKLGGRGNGNGESFKHPN